MHSNEPSVEEKGDTHERKMLLQQYIHKDLFLWPAVHSLVNLSLGLPSFRKSPNRSLPPSLQALAPYPSSALSLLPSSFSLFLSFVFLSLCYSLWRLDLL
ncbi:hypothetical protein CIPAW_10G049600 [Carya illinoinensis]|uniref:Uncharacterized protein n=1 Tax=Carya illinoinensis TaxID=32201 RepID=A0A8T1P456_CARIL|nr:hypothetical protein CIPAW_10G049600 [Carya illinoinensis]